MTSLNFLLTRALGRQLRRGRRDRLHAARPRRQRGAVAGARGGPRRRRPLRGRARRPLARPRRPRVAALRADACGRLPDRVERGRDDAGRRADRRARARRRRARVGGRRPLRPARADRRLGLGRRRAALLAVQVLRSAHGDGVRQARVPREPAAVQGAPVRQRAGREPLPARNAAARAAGRLRRGRRVRRVARLGRDRRPRASLGQRFLDGVPEAVELYGLRTMEGRVPTFAFNLPAARRSRSRPSWPRARSPSGTATTTRSRS